MKWRTYSIRSICLLTVGAALFFAGYRIGIRHGRDSRLDEVRNFDDLIELIKRTVKPESWDEVGGPGKVDQFRSINCFFGPADDPFAPSSNKAADSPDPFATP